LVFPTVDLTTFEFDMDAIGMGLFPTYFNGMVVYNRGVGFSKAGTIFISLNIYITFSVKKKYHRRENRSTNVPGMSRRYT